MTPQGQDQSSRGWGQAGRQPQAGAWEGGGRPQRRKDVIYLISRPATERMEEKNNLGAHHLGEMLSGAKRHQAVPKRAGKLNLDESHGVGSRHLSHKPAANPEKTHFPAPRVATVSLDQLCRKGTGLKIGLFLPPPSPPQGWERCSTASRHRGDGQAQSSRRRR